MDISETSAWYAWLPLWNTIILLSSSVTVHIAHLGLLDGSKKKFNLWLGITVLLGIIFVGVQAYEYYEAYAHFGLTLNSGIYGSTFFMLTGFHGFHVLMGMTMLIQWLRSVAAATLLPTTLASCVQLVPHFVDVVWVGLFLLSISSNEGNSGSENCRHNQRRLCAALSHSGSGHRSVFR